MAGVVLHQGLLRDQPTHLFHLRTCREGLQEDLQEYREQREPLHHSESHRLQERRLRHDWGAVQQGQKDRVMSETKVERMDCHQIPEEEVIVARKEHPRQTGMNVRKTMDIPRHGLLGHRHRNRHHKQSRCPIVMVFLPAHGDQELALVPIEHHRLPHCLIQCHR